MTLSTGKETDETREMEGVVSMFLRVKKITLHTPTNNELADYAAAHLAKYGLVLDESAKEVLIGSINVLKKNKYFYGLHTVTDLCSDIVYSLFSKPEAVGFVITAEMLKDFSEDSEYIKRTIMKIKKTVTLGF